MSFIPTVETAAETVFCVLPQRMTINFGEVFLAVVICSIITIVFYILSWFNHEENEDGKNSTKRGTSNMQGLDNDQAIPRGEPNETLNFDANRFTNVSEHQSSGVIIKEKADLSRLQDEDLRARISDSRTGENHLLEDYVNVEHHNSISEYDPVVHSDTKDGRLHLAIRYDDERSKLIVQILSAQGLIRPEQFHSPEMCLEFTLIGPYINENETEKHARVVVDNAAVLWKEPMTFCITFENVIKQNLYVTATNTTDPAAPRDREVSISLSNLDRNNKEINDWFDLQYVQSSY